jgi:SET domain
LLIEGLRLRLLGFRLAIVASIRLKVELDPQGKGKRLVSTEAIKKGEIFHHIREYTQTETATYTSIQTDFSTHIEEYYVSYLNHSCAPTVILDMEAMVFRAARDIQPGEELNFFYPSNEWKMAEPFACECGAVNCLGHISGAKDVTLSTLSRYHVSRHIINMALGALAQAQVEPATSSAATDTAMAVPLAAAV